MEKIRYLIFKHLFTKSEKYLLIRAIDDRIENIDKITVSERWVEKDFIRDDIENYKMIRRMFSTPDWY